MKCSEMAQTLHHQENKVALYHFVKKSLFISVKEAPWCTPKERPEASGQTALRQVGQTTHHQKFEGQQTPEQD